MLISSTSYGTAFVPRAAVCIIGAGAAGITLACEFDGCGFPVLLLEAGGLKPDAALIDHYNGTASPLHPDLTQYGRMAFGGTTSIWGGRCVPFDPIDFERRDYIANSGWPITYGELARYYPRALEYCDAGRFDFTASGSFRKLTPTISGFQGGHVVLDDCIERYSLPTNFGTRYRKKIERSVNVTALLNARCVKLNKRIGEDRIESIEIVDQAGRRRTIHAERFVLATGGIETARLLLISNGGGDGLGNHNDKVGRYYACHFETRVGKVVPHGATVSFKFQKSDDGIYCRRKLLFTAQAQRQHRLLNTALRLHVPDYSDASHGSAVMSTIFLAKSTLIPEYCNILQQNLPSAAVASVTAHVRNIVTGIPQLLQFTSDYLFRLKLATRKLPYTLVSNADGSYPLEVNCEQTPLESNRIRLGSGVDAHGLRHVHAEWRVSDDDVEAAIRSMLLLRETMNRGGSARLILDETTLRERIAASPPLGGHHLGTTRMAATARDGVVDNNCALFEVPNLFVASSAVFPTTGHANPTLTIVALAVRLAAHLKKIAA